MPREKSGVDRIIPPKGYCYVEGEIKVRPESGLAILFSDGDKEVWLPISQIEDEQENEDGTVTLLIPEWLAEEKGLI